VAPPAELGPLREPALQAVAAGELAAGVELISRAMAAGELAAGAVAEAAEAVEAAELNLTSSAVPYYSQRSLPVDQRGTLPCLRFGSSSRLVDSIRNPATSFRRVSAGSITSSM
jgi:hypothetical protein